VPNLDLNSRTQQGLANLKMKFKTETNKLCPVCGGDHNVIIVPLENGRRIITLPFPKDRAARLGITELGEVLD
jgi:hypothetical protein